MDLFSRSMGSMQCPNDLYPPVFPGHSSVMNEQTAEILHLCDTCSCGPKCVMSSDISEKLILHPFLIHENIPIDPLHKLL